MTWSRRYRSYVLALLTAILTFNFVDRLALGVVLQDLKADLHVTDTQLGFLGGFSFALFYSILGVPIARWADRGNRVTIISLTAAVWSVAVALCGAAATFVQLLLIRVGVAIGEAGAFAPALSLISDSFNRAERPRAMASYTLAWPLSCVVGYFLAGWLNQHYGWRWTFVVLALPGVVLSLVARLSLREPRLDKAPALINAPSDCEGVTAIVAAQPRLKDVLVVLWRNRSFRRLLFCVSVSYFFAYGIVQWQPAFFMRSFGLTSEQVGAVFAALYGLGGFVGTYVGGRFASHYAAHNEKRQLVAVALAWMAAGILSFSVYLSRNVYLSFGLMGCCLLVQAASSGPLFGTLQTLVPESMRAVSVSLVMLFANLLGMGFGPLAAGALSDALRPWAGDESLRYALLCLAPGYVVVGWFAWRASQTVTDDIAAACDPDASASADRSAQQTSIVHGSL